MNVPTSWLKKKMKTCNLQQRVLRTTARGSIGFIEINIGKAILNHPKFTISNGGIKPQNVGGQT
jgi:hypothetical protein